MSSIRSAIASNIITALQAIQTGNGYANTVQSVFLWRDNLASTLDTPFINVAALYETKAEGPHPALSCYLNASIECYIAFTPEDGDVVSGWTAIEPLIADVEKAILADNTRGGNAITTFVDGWSIPPQEREGLLVATVNVRVQYRHQWKDPGGTVP